MDEVVNYFSKNTRKKYTLETNINLTYIVHPFDHLLQKCTAKVIKGTETDINDWSDKQFSEVNSKIILLLILRNWS